MKIQWGSLHLLLAMVVYFSFLARAQSFDPIDASGRKIISFLSPSSKSEICVLPHHPRDSAYSAQDEADEAFLCKLDYYGTTVDSQRVAVCPKLNSTNPGLNLLLNKIDFSYPSFPVNCQSRDKKLELIAKHKQSISCSYTPSLLTYYHLSRQLGGILNVPVAVLRTVDKDEHLQWTKEAISYFSSSNNDLIYQNWLHFSRAHSSPEKYPQIFTRNKQFLFGALTMNALDEKYYSDVSGKGDYSTRELRFQKLQPFQKISDNLGLASINHGLSLQEKIQNLVQMKDVSDMILMDYLLNQADRIGNVHYLDRFYTFQNGELLASSKATEGALAIKQMILKDNDCGITKENRFKKFGILEKVRHLSPQTYRLFLNWARKLDQPEMIEFMKKELLLTTKDLFDPKRGIIANAHSAKNLLMKNCRTGFLMLDIDPAYIDQTPTFNLSQCELPTIELSSN